MKPELAILNQGHYVRPMPQFEFCLPTVGKAVPASPDWLHEIKYDGYRYRLRLERDGDRVRLITRGGHNAVEAASLRIPSVAQLVQIPIARAASRVPNFARKLRV